MNVDGGRRTALTPEVHAQVVDRIRKGNTLENAAATVGVTERTLYNWFDRGRAFDAALHSEDGSIELKPDDERFYNFFQDCEKAWALAEADSVEAIVQAGTTGLRYKVIDAEGNETEVAMEPDLKQANWYLERSRHKKWGRRQQLEVTGEGGGPVRVEHSASKLLADRLGQMNKREVEAAEIVAEIEAEEVVEAEIVTLASVDEG